MRSGPVTGQNRPASLGAAGQQGSFCFQVSCPMRNLSILNNAGGCGGIKISQHFIASAGEQWARMGRGGAQMEWGHAMPLHALTKADTFYPVA